MPDRGLSEDFGGYLRRERESRGIAIADVAQRTRIKERWLRLIDEGQLEELPAAVFVRGFVRAYARAIGADDELAARLLSTRLAERMEPAGVVPATLFEIGREASDDVAEGNTFSRQGKRRIWVTAVVVAAVALLATTLLVRRPIAPTASSPTSEATP